jgi:histidyl-tRNA synthetase
MFRGERPARGRYRQFSQVGAEIFGDDGPGADAEMIDMLVGFLHDIEIPKVEVFVNSLGGRETRGKYRDVLVQHLTPKASSLSPDSQRRLATNPLRILDSKDPRDQDAVRGVPTILDVLEGADREHFERLRSALDALGTPYTVDPLLVRGLDYYTRTLFEIKGAYDKLGAGSTLLGGGRYDFMVADLGGPQVPAIGFAAGLERLLIASEIAEAEGPVDAVVAPLGEAAARAALVIGRDLRRGGVRCEVDTRSTSLKSKLRRANALAARIAVVLGDSELAENVVQVKDLLGHSEARVARDDVVRDVAARLAAAKEATS